MNNMSTLNQEPLLPHVKIKLEKEEDEVQVNPRNITNHNFRDWKLNPNVQVKIILHKLDFSKHYGNPVNNLLPRRERSKNLQEPPKLNYETVTPNLTPLNSEDDNNSKQFLEDLKNIVLQCESGCSICCQFITQLGLHVREHMIHKTALGSENNRNQERSFEVPNEIGVEGEPFNYCDLIAKNSGAVDNNCNSSQFEALTFHAVLEEFPTTKLVNDELVQLPTLSSSPEPAPGTKPWNEMFHICTNIKSEPIDSNCNTEMEDPLYNPYEGYVDATTDSGYTNNTDFNAEEEFLTQNTNVHEIERFNEVLIDQVPLNHQTKPEPHYCEPCNLCFCDKSLLIEHNAQVHDHADQANRHLSSVLASVFEKPRPHLCTICNESFRFLIELHRHHKKVHFVDAEYKCDTCNIKFDKEIKLNTHKLMFHRVTIPKRKKLLHYCGTCGKGFSRSDGMKLHLRIHTGERPFKCHICNKHYRQKAHRDKHLKSDAHKKVQIGLAAKKTSKARSRQKSNAPSKLSVALKHVSVPPEQVQVTVVQNLQQDLEQQLDGNNDEDVQAQVQVQPTNETSIINRYNCIFCGVNFFTALELEQHALQFHYAVY